MVLAALNLVLPGSGLVMRDRLLLGLPLLVIAACAVVVLIAAGLIATPGFATELRWGAVAVYLATAAAAGGLWFALERRRRWNDARVVELHRAAAAAYLTDDLATATTRARELVRASGGSAGAWELVAMTAEAAGHRQQAARARRHARQAAERAA